MAQRSREIGVRTALGATSGQIAALVLRSGAAIVGLGLAAGLGAAASLVQLLSKILYGVRPFDPVTFAAVPAFLLLAATVACIGPRCAATDGRSGVRLGADPGLVLG